MNVIQAFKILELPLTANQMEVKASFRRLAKKWHPDVNSSDTTKRFQHINEAYEIAYKYASKNKNVNNSRPPAKTTVKQPVKTTSSKSTAASTRKTKPPGKKSDVSSSSAGWIIVGVVVFLLLCLMVPGLQLVVLILILYGVTRIL